MKKLLMLAVLLLSGCNTFKKVFPQYDNSDNHGPSALPDIYTLSGTTAVDYQIIEPVRVIDSMVTVKVKRPGEDWEVCNKYEVKLSTSGPGGGAVWFERICYPTFNSHGDLIYLVLTGKPVAPAGTQYEIQSVLTSSTPHELY